MKITGVASILGSDEVTDLILYGLIVCLTISLSLRNDNNWQFLFN